MHLMGVCLKSVHLTGVSREHLIGVYFMRVPHRRVPYGRTSRGETWQCT